MLNANQHRKNGMRLLKKVSFTSNTNEILFDGLSADQPVYHIYIDAMTTSHNSKIYFMQSVVSQHVVNGNSGSLPNNVIGYGSTYKAGVHLVVIRDKTGSGRGTWFSRTYCYDDQSGYNVIGSGACDLTDKIQIRPESGYFSSGVATIYAGEGGFSTIFDFLSLLFIIKRRKRIC